MVNDKWGQGINDITKDTLAFAINLDNTLDSNGNAKYPNDDWTETDITSDGLPVGLINIDKLEEITGYDFLSNIPAEIQEAIEGRKYPDIKEKIYAKGIKQRPPSSSLLASFPSVFTNERTWFDSSIGHDSIPNQIETTADRVSGNIDISETSFNQNSAFKTVTRQSGSSEISTSSVHSRHNRISQVSFDQTTTEQISRIQLGFPENSSFQTRAFQNSTSEIGFSEIDTLQRSFPKIGSSQVDSLKTDSPKLSTLISTKMSESNTSKISFPRSYRTMSSSVLMQSIVRHLR